MFGYTHRKYAGESGHYYDITLNKETVATFYICKSDTTGRWHIFSQYFCNGARDLGAPEYRLIVDAFADVGSFYKLREFTDRLKAVTVQLRMMESME